MIDWTAGFVDQGFRDQAEHNRARRLQNRQAIQQYMNDAAAEGREITPDEIAKFAEEISGGSNWLTRAFPAQQFSQSMIEQQNRRAQQQRVAQSAQTLQAQALEQKSIGSLVLSEIQSGTSDEKIAERLASQGLSPEVLERHNIDGMVNSVKQAAAADLINSPQFKLISDESQLDELLKTQPAGLRDIARQYGMQAIRERQAQEGNLVMQRATLYDDVGLMGMNDSQLLAQARTMVKAVTGREDQHHIATVMDLLRAKRQNALQAREEASIERASRRSDKHTDLLLRFIREPTIQSLIANGDRDGAVNFLRTVAPDQVKDPDVFVDQLRPIVLQNQYAQVQDAARKSAIETIKASRGRVNVAVGAALQAASNDTIKDTLQAVSRIVTSDGSDVYVPPGMEDAFGEQVAALAKKSTAPNEILTQALAAVGGGRVSVDDAVQSLVDSIVTQRFPTEPNTVATQWLSRAKDRINSIAEALRESPDKMQETIVKQRKALEAVIKFPYNSDNPDALRSGAQQLLEELNSVVSSARSAPQTVRPTQVSNPSTYSAEPQAPDQPVPMWQLQAERGRLMREIRGMRASPERAKLEDRLREVERRIYGR